MSTVARLNWYLVKYADEKSEHQDELTRSQEVCVRLRIQYGCKFQYNRVSVISVCYRHAETFPEFWEWLREATMNRTMESNLPSGGFGQLK